MFLNLPIQFGQARAEPSNLLSSNFGSERPKGERLYLWSCVSPVCWTGWYPSRSSIHASWAGPEKAGISPHSCCDWRMILLVWGVADIIFSAVHQVLPPQCEVDEGVFFFVWMDHCKPARSLSRACGVSNVRWLSGRWEVWGFVEAPQVGWTWCW